VQISTTCRTALVAASALSVLAPTQALAAEVPACTTENIAYLNSQAPGRERGAGAHKGALPLLFTRRSTLVFAGGLR